MGKPTITKFGEDEYVEGTTLIINDANMLAEIAGNIESRTNVQAFHNAFALTFYWNKSHDNGYTYGNDAVVAAVRLPRRFTVIDAQFIGYAYETSAASNFENGQVNHGSGNEVVCKVELFGVVDNELGVKKTFEFPNGTLVKTASLTVDEGAKMYLMREVPGTPEDINLEVATDSTLVISCNIPSGAQANFNPWMQATIYCKEEHGR